MYINCTISGVVAASGLGSNLLLLGIGYLIWFTLWFIRKVSRGEIDWSRW